ncbi:MAG: IS110 family transposase [Syntrophobacterales bacterium]|jgi:transposase
MYYTGIDLHKKTSFITTIDARGKIITRANLQNVEEDILAYFANLGEETKIVIESMSSWYWLYDLLSAEGFAVVISNPVKTKAIASAKIKNDKIDSHMLAQLLRADLISTVHVSSLETRKLKELLRHRSRLVRDATRMKNRIHMLLMKNNFSSPVSDLFGVQGLRYLKEIDLPDYHRHQVETYLLLYEKLQKQIKPLTRRVRAIAKQNHTAQLLMTIPGIGPITAMFIVAEVEDISRFRSYRNLASYAGLVPSLDASAGKEKTGRITKQGSRYLRTALVEAAQAAARMQNCRLRIFFRRRIVKAGYQKAVVATAHKILQYAFYVWKNQTPYKETYPVCA